jgi:NitT/TauT family transport system substrate-binding protein
MTLERPIVGFILLASLIGVGCSHRQAPRSVKLRQEWFANANFAGAVLAAEEFGPDHKINLTIEEGSENVDPVALVAAGSSDLGDAAADRVLSAIDKGAPLVIVGVVNPSSPTVFLARKERHIKTPYDFEGHKVGVLSGTATEYVYRALVRNAKLNQAKIKEMEIGFDLQGFIAGVYDVRPAFDYDEPVSLDLQHIAYTTIDPRDYGVHFIGTVYFTRRALIAKDRGLIQDVVWALADGWRLAIQDPKRAITVLKRRYPSINADRELLSLKRAIEYVEPASGKVLLASHDDWSGTLMALQELGVIKERSLDASLDESFINAYYSHESRESR